MQFMLTQTPFYYTVDIPTFFISKKPQRNVRNIIYAHHYSTLHLIIIEPPFLTTKMWQVTF